jgi:hypothetical protein
MTAVILVSGLTLLRSSVYQWFDGVVGRGARAVATGPE